MMSQRTLLTLSLALNLLLGGIMVGHQVKEATKPDWRMAMAEKMPPASREQFRAAMETMLKNQESQRDAAQAARDRVTAALKADPFDEKAYDRAVEESLKIRSQSRRDMYEATKEIARTLSAKDRAELADAMKQHSDRWHNRHKK